MLEISIKEENQHRVVSLQGEVDASNSVELDEAIHGLLEQGCKRILVDGSALDYISSAGLGVFMSYLEDFQEKGVTFIIYGMNEKVFNVFHILGLDQLITMVNSHQDALDILYEA
ncbi:MAG: STAS domain-containing protein [Lunatimonas sp.]|uniref:STAS domain-containing protein n=1 Tax=Lunatimonas sp. TaxID=2060141 RepID=UPI00263AD26C|nr:STAS domain-containing protein [Lunatimonas sp.]MCC5937752.1 STAS domain-containing protein [Lunatimonas sp.]